MIQGEESRCPFCSDEVRSKALLLDDLIMVIADRSPVAEGHLLVIPSKHEASLVGLPVEVLERLFIEAVDRGRAMVSGGADGFNIGVNDGRAAGQTVLHAHLHVIPRFKGDTPRPQGGVRKVLPDRAGERS